MGSAATDTETTAGQWFCAVGNNDAGMVAGIPVPRKVNLPYLTAALKNFLLSPIRFKQHVRSDNAPAIISVVDDLAKALPGVVNPQRSPLYISASRRMAERVVRIMGDGVRVLALQVEGSYGRMLPAGHHLWPWLARHAGFVGTRFARNKHRGTRPTRWRMAMPMAVTMIAIMMTMTRMMMTMMTMMLIINSM